MLSWRMRALSHRARQGPGAQLVLMVLVSACSALCLGQQPMPWAQPHAPSLAPPPEEPRGFPPAPQLQLQVLLGKNRPANDSDFETWCPQLENALTVELAGFVNGNSETYRSQCVLNNTGLLFTKFTYKQKQSAYLTVSATWLNRNFVSSNLKVRLFQSFGEHVANIIKAIQNPPLPCQSTFQLLLRDYSSQQQQNPQRRAFICPATVSWEFSSAVQQTGTWLGLSDSLCCLARPPPPPSPPSTPSVPDGVFIPTLPTAEPMSPAARRQATGFSMEAVAVVCSLAGAAVISTAVAVVLIWRRRAAAKVLSYEAKKPEVERSPSSSADAALPPVGSGLVQTDSEEQAVSLDHVGFALTAANLPRRGPSRSSPNHGRGRPVVSPQAARAAELTADLLRAGQPQLATPFAAALPPTTVGLLELFGEDPEPRLQQEFAELGRGLGAVDNGLGVAGASAATAPSGAVSEVSAEAFCMHISAPEGRTPARVTGAPGMSTSGQLAAAAQAGPGVRSELDPRDVQVMADGLLGQGAFGTVYKGLYRGRSVAVKVLNHMQLGDDVLSNAKDVESFRRELLLLSRLTHPNIVHVLGGCAHQRHPFLVMELMPNCLHRFIHTSRGPLPLRSVLQVARDVAAGLAYLHPEVVHRDLKPANILLDDKGTAKISDFGLARSKLKPYLSTQQPDAGSVAYMAPECFDPAIGGLSTKCDVYSFGVLLWEMVTQEHPWAGDSNVVVIYKVAVRQQHPPIPTDRQRCPEEVALLMSECMTFKPSDRPDMQSVLARLDALLSGPC